MVRDYFRPAPYLAFPLYPNSASGNGTETRDTIYTEDNTISTQYFNTITIPTPLDLISLDFTLLSVRAVLKVTMILLCLKNLELIC